MIKISVTNQDGEIRIIEAEIGRTLMEAIRDNAFDQMLALCGGCCSCATCHVHVDAQFASGMPSMTENESDLLDSSDHRDQTSRLSCQIPLTRDLDGLRIQLAAED